MHTADATSLCCSAQGCVYRTDPGTEGLFCVAHWEMVPGDVRQMLVKERERYGTSQRWLHIARLATELVAKEELARAIAEEHGHRPKSEARRVA